MYRILDKDSLLEVREYAPQKRTVSVRQNGSLLHYYLQFPYLVFAYNQANLRVAFADRPLKPHSWFGNKQLYIVELPNLYYGGKMCLGNDFWTEHVGIDKCIDRFWNSAFGSIDPFYQWINYNDPKSVRSALRRKLIPNSRWKYSRFIEVARYDQKPFV